MAERLGLRFWNDPNTAIARLETLGAIIRQGTLSEADFDFFERSPGTPGRSGAKQIRRRPSPVV
jgi:hypothetical protein